MSISRVASANASLILSTKGVLGLLGMVGLGGESIRYMVREESGGSRSDSGKGSGSGLSSLEGYVGAILEKQRAAKPRRFFRIFLVIFHDSHP
jgi:hypothetical protein